MNTIIKKTLSLIRKFLLSKNQKVNYIIILSFKFLGDTVFTIPAIRSLQKIFPKHQIIIFCYESNKTIYELEFKNVQYILFNKKDLDLENRMFNLKFLNARKHIINLNAEYLFDFSSNYKTAILSLLTGIKYSFGFGNRLLTGFYYSFEVKIAEKAFDIFFNPIRELDKNNVYKECLSFNVHFSKDKEIILFPSAGWQAKQWGSQKFFKLITKLNLSYKTKLVSEPGFYSVDELQYLFENQINYKITENIQSLIEEIKDSSVVVSNDTGPLYIAALLGHPTFTIYGPTGPLFHKFDGENHRFIRKKLKCSPKLSEKLCFTFGGRQGCPSNECMHLLNSNEVYEQLNEFLHYLDISKINLLDD